MSTPQTGPESTESHEPTEGDPITPGTDADVTESDTEPDTYPAETVRKLRDENANYRTRAKDAEARADTLAQELFTARVAATGKLENPAEIPFNADILDNLDAINEKIDEAIAERPYIQKRRAIGDVGQGNRGDVASAPTFSDLFR